MDDALRVAVIDDDAAQLQLLSQIVASQRPGWAVASIVADEAWLARAASDPAAAVDGAAAVIIDYRLAGSEVVSLIPGLSAIARVVVMSGSTEGVDQAACLAAGAGAVVEKPFGLDQAEHMLASCDRVFVSEGPFTEV